MLVILPSNSTQLNEVYTLIKSIQYENMEDEISPCNPFLYHCTMGTNSRTILIKVNDEVKDSPEQETFVTFETVNDPPVLDLNTNTGGTGYFTIFQEGQGALNIASVVLCLTPPWSLHVASPAKSPSSSPSSIRFFGRSSNKLLCH